MHNNGAPRYTHIKVGTNKSYFITDPLNQFGIEVPQGKQFKGTFECRTMQDHDFMGSHSRGKIVHFSGSSHCTIS